MQYDFLAGNKYDYQSGIEYELNSLGHEVVDLQIKKYARNDRETELDTREWINIMIMQRIFSWMIRFGGMQPPDFDNDD